MIAAAVYAASSVARVILLSLLALAGRIIPTHRRGAGEQ